VVREPELGERLAFIQNAVGGVPGPLDSFLVLRGIKTLPVRMDRHASNAQAVAEVLAPHPGVEHVYYPDLPNPPQFDWPPPDAERRRDGVLPRPRRTPAARRFAEATQIFAWASRAGGVESLVEVPAAMTHLSTAASGLAVDPALVRLSVRLVRQIWSKT
jgi:cystathionine gamma-synthase